MERGLGRRVSRRYYKVEVINKAKKGVFNGNPLLVASHWLLCKACGCVQKVIYLNYLKSGSFELGKTRAVEVAVAAPTILGLSLTRETITPIIIRVKCKRCQTEIMCSPVSLEYLLFIARKQQKLEYMYV